MRNVLGLFLAGALVLVFSLQPSRVWASDVGGDFCAAKGEITVGGEAVEFAVAEGGVLLLRDLDIEPSWQIITFNRTSGRDVRLNVFGTTFPAHHSSGIEPRLLGVPIGAVSLSAISGKNRGLSFLSTLVVLDGKSEAKSESNFVIDDPSFSDLCCVTCGKVTACASSVMMSCGSCGYDNDIS